MTICIAVMCENKYVVVITDKMLTLMLPSIQYEADYDKAPQIAKNCVAATAGSAIAYTPILRIVLAEIMKRGVSDIESMADVTSARASQWTKHALKKPWRPHLIFAWPPRFLVDGRSPTNH